MTSFKFGEGRLDNWPQLRVNSKSIKADFKPGLEARHFTAGGGRQSCELSCIAPKAPKMGVDFPLNTSMNRKVGLSGTDP